jgi:hypothetical protein
MVCWQFRACNLLLDICIIESIDYRQGLTGLKGIFMDWRILAASVVKIERLDVFVIVFYFVVILGMGIWAGLKRRGETESKGYFLAGGMLT